MDISNLMIHAQQVEEIRLKINNRYAKQAFKGGSSKRWFEIQGKPRFKKRFSNQAPSEFLKARDDRMSKPKSQKVRSANSPNKKPICRKCGKKHWGECLVGTENCFGFGMCNHKVRDFPNVRCQKSGSVHFRPSNSNSEVLRTNSFYALRSRGEHESSPDVVTKYEGMNIDHLRVELQFLKKQQI
ncbi:uncharacterized protein [Solanum lycopersicum]|uniref:uncharacterized protein n=1 Tax=Solanum lycopersicum TaxID=4081 RepID=UPI003749E30B